MTDGPDDDAAIEDAAPIDIAGQVKPPTIEGLPAGYRYGVTRYADVILKNAFPTRLANIAAALEGFAPTLDELRAGGGGRTVFVSVFLDPLSALARGGSALLAVSLLFVWLR